MTTTTKPEAPSKRMGKTTRAPKVSANTNAAGAASTPPAVTAAPKQPTKASQVEALLIRADGATLDELCAATGWLPHTCRAFFTGLRKKGRILDRNKREDGTTIYKLVSGAAAGASALPETAEAVS